VIIPCGKAKRRTGWPWPAREAYVGSPFKVNRGYAEAVAPGRWLILSAKYGLLDPDQLIDDYDVSFNRPASGPIETGALAAQARARGLAGPVVGLGGMAYVSALRSALSGFEEVELSFPFEGLSLGRAMAAVKRATPCSTFPGESPRLSASGGNGPPRKRRKDMARKSQKLSGVEAAAAVLRENDGGPMKLKDIVEGALKKAPHLKGRGSVQAPLDAAAKKGRLFKKVDTGTYELLPETEAPADEHAADLKAAAAAADEASKRRRAKAEPKAEAKTEVEPDPKPKRTRRKKAEATGVKVTA
jgi:Family of unknown function (DUF6884)